MGRQGDGATRRWGDEEMGRWGDEEMGRRGDREMGRGRDWVKLLLKNIFKNYNYGKIIIRTLKRVQISGKS
jgi:hypothetical protein